MSDTTELLKWTIIQWHIETSDMPDRERFVIEEILRLAHADYLTLTTGIGPGSLPFHFRYFEKRPLTDEIGCARVVDSMVELFTDEEDNSVVPKIVLELLISFISTEIGITSEVLGDLLLQT